MLRSSPVTEQLVASREGLGSFVLIYAASSNATVNTIWHSTFYVYHCIFALYKLCILTADLLIYFMLLFP
jgi:hypothetical protein